LFIRTCIEKHFAHRLMLFPILGPISLPDF